MKTLDTQVFLQQYDISFLQGLSSFGALNETFITYIVEHSEALQVEPGDMLYTKDQFPTDFYMLIDGKICLYKGSRLRNLKFKTLSTGECVGFISMLCMHPLLGDVVPEERSVVLRISNDLLASLPALHGEQFSIFMINMARNIGRAYIDMI